MIIGRKTEQQELLKAYASEYSEFVAATGRRRVGKTFLVRETFDYKFAFQHSGLARQNTNANTQVRNIWEVLVFERVCFEHIRQIKTSVGHCRCFNTNIFMACER